MSVGTAEVFCDNFRADCSFNKGRGPPTSTRRQEGRGALRDEAPVLIAAALAACVCWMVAWPPPGGLPRSAALDAAGLKGVPACPRVAGAGHRTTWRRHRQCVQRAIVLPRRARCRTSHTVDDDKSWFSTNQHAVWVATRFNLGYLQMPAGARLDAELRLFGTPRCRGGGRDGNNFAPAALLRPRQGATTIDINKPYPKRLCGQWAQQALWGRKFRVPT